MPGGYQTNVFVNCPFDAEFRPVLEAVLFCVMDCGLSPRIATERIDAETRLEKIVELIEDSRYSIHDLSRSRSRKKGEFARMNMPFELGVDYGFRRAGRRFSDKRFLVMAAKPFDHQVALSDIAGFDVRAHANDGERAIGHVRAWLRSLELSVPPPSQIVADYLTFQRWEFDRLRAAGWAEPDIADRSTTDLFDSMQAWQRPTDEGRTSR